MTTKFEEKDFSDEGLNKAMWKKIFTLFKPYFKYVYILIAFNLLIAISDVLFPIFNKQAVDYYAAGMGSQSELIRFAVLYLLLIIGTTMLHYFFFRVAGKAEMGFSFDLREKCFAKLQELSFAYYDVTPSGWLLSRLTSDIFRLSEIISWSFGEFAWGIPLMCLSTYVMWTTDHTLTLVVLAAVPFLAIATFYFQKRILRSYREVRKINSKITAAFAEGINGAKTTKTLVLEENNLREFKEETADMRTHSIKAAKLVAVFRPLITLLSSMSMAAILYFGGTLVFNKTIGFGTLLLFTSYAQQFFEPLNTIAFIMQDIQMAQASGERIVYLLDSQPSIVDSEEVIEKYGTIFEEKKENYEEIKGDIEFSHVDFSYIEGEEVLKDFNLSVKAGQTIALVGETGSGKSTIVNLLCRFYEPTGGQLLIDGKDYRERSIGWLHSKLGYVLQAPHLFSGSIYDNIHFGRLDATKEEVIEAAKLVNAHDFIMSFKDGYDTDVGEGGSRLSTGQKQLISFARAVLADPSIFVLDEATASIDTETEQIIQYAVENIMKDKTSFVVAHRLSTIVHADRILVIRKGQIVEDGNHEELMKLGGYYYRLYTNQFEEQEDRNIR
ncbi:MAG: ABC transporter ATP-binding protein [Erysipelotrichaceae bacterium]|nr:ABC transporter ATP-binding protein [Erysipelotrichaceae bacterium]